MAMSTPDFSADELKKFVIYEPDTGFFYRVNVQGEISKKQAGALHPTGYRAISAAGLRTYAHRMAWYYMTGEWPGKMYVDHINGDRDDNRFANLRLVSSAENAWNSSIRSHNTSGYKGVSWHKGKQRWIATITVNGKQRQVGQFLTKEEAYRCYCDEAERVHGEHSNLGRPKWTTPVMTEATGAEAVLIRAQIALQDAQAIYDSGVITPTTSHG